MGAEPTQFVPTEEEHQSYHKNDDNCRKNSNQNQQQREFFWNIFTFYLFQVFVLHFELVWSQCRTVLDMQLMSW